MFKKYQEFIPKLFQVLKKYNFHFFKRDLFAGMTVGVIAVPLAMAFALASGVEPERGLYTAIVGGFLISLLGGSRVQIGGPTGAFVVVVYSVVQRHGYEGLVLATFLAGLMLLVMGAFRLGSLIKYVPHPLVTGFTTGIALVIFSAQLKDFFGLSIAQVPADFLQKWHAYFTATPTWDPTTTCVAGGTLGLILLLRRYCPTLPWAIISIAAATAVCWVFHIPADTIASRFGEVPRSLPSPELHLDFSRVVTVLPDAITIALLAGLESLLSAVIADGMVRGRHKPNCELIGQGLANLGSICFGGIPATAAIARTATNIKSGAYSPIAGMVHALTVFAIMFCFAPIVGHIPLAALAAVLVVVSWNMSEIHHFRELLKAPRGDVMVLLTAFFLTVLVDLTVAVEIGMVLAAFLFMKRMSELKQVIALRSRHLELGIDVYDLHGPFFFGVADRLKEVLYRSEQRPKTFVLRMKHVPVLDATGLHALHAFHQSCKNAETEFVLIEVQPEPAELLQKFGLGGLIRTEESLGTKT
jgi:SulP family sulfate permease